MHAKNEIDVKNGHTQGGAVWWTDASKHPNKSRFLPSVSHLDGWHLQDKCIYNRCIYPATTSPHEWIQDANIISWSNINNSRGTVASGGLVCQRQQMSIMNPFVIGRVIFTPTWKGSAGMHLISVEKRTPPMPRCGRITPRKRMQRSPSGLGRRGGLAHGTSLYIQRCRYSTS